MFDIDKILGKKKSKKSTNFSDMTFSKTFGKNPFSDMVGGITKKPLKNMSASKMPKIAGASIKMQSVWKNMTPKQKMVARTKYPDTDRDGVPNKYDCQPRNPMRQETSDWRPIKVNPGVGYPGNEEKGAWQSDKHGVVVLVEEWTGGDEPGNVVLLHSIQGYNQGLYPIMSWDEVEDEVSDAWKFADVLMNTIDQIGVNATMEKYRAFSF